MREREREREREKESKQDLATSYRLASPTPQPVPSIFQCHTEKLGMDKDVATCSYHDLYKILQQIDQVP